MIPSTGRRLWARLIDSFFMLILELPFWKVICSLLWSETKWVAVHWTLLLYFVCARWAYQITSYSLFAATPGKLFTNLRLFGSSTEKPPTLPQIFLRVIAGELSFFFSWALYASLFFRKDRRHWIDLFSDTRVVSTKSEDIRLHPSRPLLASLLMVAYLVTGFLNAFQVVQSLEWQRDSLLVSESFFAENDFDFEVD